MPSIAYWLTSNDCDASGGENETNVEMGEAFPSPMNEVSVYPVDIFFTLIRFLNG